MEECLTVLFLVSSGKFGVTFCPKLDLALFVELICSLGTWTGGCIAGIFLVPSILWTPYLLNVCVLPLNRYKKLLDIEIITKAYKFH